MQEKVKTEGAVEVAQDEESWRNVEPYPPIVDMLKRQLSLDMQKLVDESPCFGWLWVEDDGSQCPEEGCVLRSHCNQAWQMGQVDRGLAAKSSAPATKEEPNGANGAELSYTEAHTVTIGTPPKSRTGKKPTKVVRNKWKGTGKYARRGYEDQGRRVDRYLAAFVAELGDPPRLPLVWNPTGFDAKFGHLGDVVIAATASYHAVLHKGTIVARFWTNASRRAIVDVVPELVNALKAYTDTLKPVPDEKPPMTPPVPCPQKSWAKVKPCTHRVTVHSAEAAIAVAEVVRKRFRF
jgi:hypothetical protein